MPTITPSGALILVADYLTDAISGLIPTPTVAANAVKQLLEIYKQQARATRDAATAQRVLRERAQVERVIHKEHQQQAAPSYPQFELEHTSNTPTLPGILQITQGFQDSPPSANTHQQRTLRKTLCFNAWKLQDTKPLSHHNRPLPAGIPYNSSVTSPMPSLTTRRATFLSITT